MNLISFMGGGGMLSGTVLQSQRSVKRAGPDGWESGRPSVVREVRNDLSYARARTHCMDEMHAMQRRLLALALYCLAENDDDESVDLQALQTRASPLAPIRPSPPRLDGW